MRRRDQMQWTQKNSVIIDREHTKQDTKTTGTTEAGLCGLIHNEFFFEYPCVF